ncbi:kinase-like protein [Aspergillus sclerotioniger CBS 115572]|uniref:non-specific serine/threonine protein kinase n=1 Tax=Aspergillus sclerotioniger CBS 115572 TaxID=1450535 RepID=A0A317XGQ8_9EURO|nr:kinase-like protein [Aspergillus sclerotioniger CBS 115572]PWY96538.1 kinase-like protein [Aspergillus sclerotioniger CBS 115572]
MQSFSTRSSIPSTSIPEALQNARKFPTSGFDIIQSNQMVEEEELPDYEADRFYPVRLGEIFENRYQVVTKLGFDLTNNQYVALKIYVHTSLFHREVPVYNHINQHLHTSTHRGRHNIRRLLDSFRVSSQGGTHAVLVSVPAQMSLRDMKLVFRKDGFDEMFVKGAITELLQAVDFLHTQGKIVHTDIHPGNMLLGTWDDQSLKALEDKELVSPVPRKPVSSTRTIYLSRLMHPRVGPMLLSDFGEAWIGSQLHGGDIMHLEYRAPETLLYISWSYPVDIWSIGLTAWDLLEPKKLFTARDEDDDLYDAAHLAQIIAALGPPPPELLKRNPARTNDFWNNDGKWLDLAPIPDDRTMESLESRLSDKSGFLRFIRRALTWLPEERATAQELLQDPWLAG